MFGNTRGTQIEGLERFTDVEAIISEFLNFKRLGNVEALGLDLLHLYLKNLFQFFISITHFSV
jgi:hypothetical protein